MKPAEELADMTVNLRNYIPCVVFFMWSRAKLIALALAVKIDE